MYDTYKHTVHDCSERRGETTFAALVVNFAKKKQKKIMIIIIIYEKQHRSLNFMKW